jgi:hypothetical protein
MTLVQKRIFVFSALGLGVILGASAIIILARGYKPDFSNLTLKPTGLLVATSQPDGAQIWVDGKLKSATNTTLNLPPDEYEVEIKKDGFSPWKKTLTLQKELVTKADAYLFSTLPNLKALTFTGASNPLLSPDGQKVVFVVSDASSSKRGLWVLDLTGLPLGLSREARQISLSLGKERDFSEAKISWSPDSKQILAVFKNKTGRILYAYILEGDKLNPNESLEDISLTLEVILSLWEKEKQLRLETQLSSLPPKLLNTLQDKVKDIQFAPDETKILYTATASASIEEKIITPPPAPSTQREERQIKPDRIYVYDLKEDKNFYLGEVGENRYSWFPTSRHIFIIEQDKITVQEYDGTNSTDIYAGPFVNSFAFPFPDATRLLILTSINKDAPPNLYAVTLK